LLLGCSAIAITYYFVARALHHQTEQRATAIATTLSNFVPGYMATGNVLLLQAAVEKYTFLDGVAYAAIHRNGKVLAHSLRSYAEELPLSVPDQDTPRLEVNHRQLSLRGRAIEETIVPILGGRLGAVHVGFWADLTQQQIQSVLLPMLGLIALLSIICTVGAGLISRHFAGVLTKLKFSANAMSKGDLETPVQLTSRDEVGEIALSLERMRTSLKAALARLARENESVQTNGKDKVYEYPML
jgi:HAMP domain-containing protein